MKLLTAATSTVAAAFLLAGSNSAYAESLDNYEFPECADERGVQVPYVENYEGSGSIVLRFNVRYLDDAGDFV